MGEEREENRKLKSCFRFNYHKNLASHRILLLTCSNGLGPSTTNGWCLGQSFYFSVFGGLGGNYQMTGL